MLISCVLERISPKLCVNKAHKDNQAKCQRKVLSPGGIQRKRAHICQDMSLRHNTTGGALQFILNAPLGWLHFK